MVPQLLEACEHELLQVHQQKLLEKDTGVVALLSNQSEDDMLRMFNLFSVKSLKNGLQPIGDITRKYINEQGDKVHSCVISCASMHDMAGGEHFER